MRELLVGLCRWVLALYFRRIEITGQDRIPTQGPVMFVLNHPNALLDPIFVLCLSGRRVSFLAKEPLFRMPIVGMFVRAFECLPVYRARDGSNPANNRKMLQRAIELLRAGNALAIFPEGTSHSDPDLRPFRSGAARIALAASSPTLATGGESVAAVQIVPCGLYYTEKTRFRSSALVSFGAPLSVPAVCLDERLEPSVEATTALTEQLERELRTVTVNASSVEAMRLAQRAERLLRGAASDLALDPEAYSPPNVEARVRTRQRLIEGYEQLKETHAGELGRVVLALSNFEQFLDTQGLRVEQRVVFSGSQLFTRALLGVIVGSVLLPLALVGVVMNIVVYRLLAWAALKYSKGEEDVIATAKVLGGLLLYPLGWGVVALVIGVTLGASWALVALLVSPLAAIAALAFVERATRELTRSLVVAKLWLRPGLKRKIIAERQAVRAAILALADHVHDA